MRLILAVAAACALKSNIGPAPLSSAHSSDAKLIKLESETEALMNILVDSLYTDKDVFLRELISNANDAIERHRLAHISDAKEDDYGIAITVDGVESRLMVRDNGIGMCEAELKSQLGTIANSSTRLAALQSASKNNLIGQFGVGFYSTFLVADRVIVHSKCEKENEPHAWVSEGRSHYKVLPTNVTGEFTHGTIVELHLKDDIKKKYLNLSQLSKVLQQYNGFVKYPVYIGLTGDEELKLVKDVNKQALWLQDPSDVSDEQYKTFFKDTWKKPVDPIAHIHFKAESSDMSFTSLLYLPRRSAKEDVFNDLEKASSGSNIMLYVQRVLVAEHRLLPGYFNFLYGIVDSNESRALKVDRQQLKDSRVVRRIKRKLLLKALEMMHNIPDEQYGEFWGGYGQNVALGCTHETDSTIRQRLLELFRFELPDGSLISLPEYKKQHFREGQRGIYYYTGDTNNVLLEIFERHNVTVLGATGAFDEGCLNQEFSGLKFIPIEKEALTFEEIARLEGGAESSVLARAKELSDAHESLEEEFAGLLKKMRSYLGHFIEVKVSKRLVASPYVVTVPEHGFTSSHEKMLRSQVGGSVKELREVMSKMKVLEVNAGHPLLQLLKEASDDELQSKLTKLILQAAYLAAGFEVTEPALLTAYLSESLEGYAQHQIAKASSRDEL